MTKEKDNVEEWRSKASKSLMILLKHIDEANLNYNNIKSRIKSYESIEEKTKILNVPFYEIDDIAGIRIIVKNTKQCFVIAEKLTTYFINNNKFNYLYSTHNYIDKPKESGYKAYHLCFIINDVKIEVQIMTSLMESFAEATHENYKKAIKENF